MAADDVRPYVNDTELLQDVRVWARARLESVYGNDDVGSHLASRPFEVRLATTRSAGTQLRIDELSRRLSLDNNDLLLLLVLLAIEPDIAFHTKRRELVNDDDFYSAGFVLSLLTDDSEEMQAFLGRLDTRAPLIRHHIVYLNTVASRLGTSLHNHLVEVDESAVAFVHDRAHWPAGIDTIAKLHPVEDRPGQTYFAGKLQQLERAMASRGRGDGTMYVAIDGLTPGSTMALALTLAAKQKRPLLEITAHLLPANPTKFEWDFRLLVREALLRDAILFVDGQRAWTDDPTITEVLRAIERSAPFFGQPILFDAHLAGDEVLKRTLSPFLELRVFPPTLDEQVMIWQDAIEHAGLAAIGEEDLRKQVCDMALSVEDIHRAVTLASDNAWLNTEDDAPSISPSALRAMATSKLNRGLHAIADRVSTTLTWNDVILPNDVLNRLMEIVTYARYQRKVFEEWGFGAKLPYGRANSSLFTGHPGTGKTMVASIIAHELGMDLFRIEMSQVISKFIGETEKNLAKVFDEASRSHAVILFDEADSLFAKRTEVKSHHDRYSNLEVNYLLQRIEDFDGVTILTSNFPQNIDDAFARRLKFKIDFPLPTDTERIELWKLMLPTDAERADDIDFPRLGCAFDFSGANIKDAVVRAAFRAAECDQPIGTVLLEAAGIAISQEMGKLIRVRDGRVDVTVGNGNEAR